MSAIRKVIISFVLALIVFLSAASAYAGGPQYSGYSTPDPEQAYYDGIYDACYWGAAMARMTRFEAEAACAYFQDKARKGNWYEQGRGWKRLERQPAAWGSGA